MAQVNIYINGRNYEIACDDGEEDHVQELGKYVDEKVSNLIARMGQIGDTRLLVMTALLIADELSDAYLKLDGDATGPGLKGDAQLGEAAEGIAKLAKRIDHIAATLESA